MRQGFSWTKVLDFQTLQQVGIQRHRTISTIIWTPDGSRQCTYAVGGSDCCKDETRFHGQELENVTLALSVFQTDVKAMGLQRYWRCVCIEAVHKLCPHCWTTVHSVLLNIKFVCPLVTELPLFATDTGEVTKACMEASKKHFLQVLQFQFFGEHGHTLFGGHSW